MKLVKVVIREVHEVTYHFPEDTRTVDALEMARNGSVAPSLSQRISMLEDSSVRITRPGTDSKLFGRFSYRWNRTNKRFQWERATRG